MEFEVWNLVCSRNTGNASTLFYFFTIFLSHPDHSIAVFDYEDDERMGGRFGVAWRAELCDAERTCGVLTEARGARPSI